MVDCDTIAGKEISKKTLETLSNGTFITGSCVLVAGFIFQIARPFRTGSAKDMSLTWIVLGIIALLLRVPYYFMSAKMECANPWKKFTSPIVLLVALILIFIIMFAEKIYFDKKDRGETLSEVTKREEKLDIRERKDREDIRKLERSI